MTNWKPVLAGLAIATSLLVACATAPSDGAPCPPVVPYSREFLARAANEQGHRFELVEMQQGTRTMSGPSKDLEALVRSQRFNHGGNPVLRWMASNVVVRTDSNDNYMPCKARSTGRIDGIVAGVMALGRASCRSMKVRSTRRGGS